MTFRTETIGDCTLILGDCQEVMPTLDKVDAVVTDPPYGIGKADWDSQYPGWLADAAFECADMVCVMPGLWALPECVRTIGDRYKSIIAGWNSNGMTFGPIGLNNWIPAVVGGQVPRKKQDAFEFAVTPGKADHPSPKPLPFMIKLLDRVTEPEWTVLDPFMGSGTTGVACTQLGRKFIGIEIDEQYFDIAYQRIEEAYRQPDIFVDAEKKATQLDLMEDGS